ncbi:MAG: flagellar motor switch protein FliG [Leptospiraceae bacterium]|nr:flagellar motor switch protein FliG [Leptospiraceae bacterium]
MIFQEGVNYHFLFGTPDSIARIQSEVSPFYNILKSTIPALPSLHSEFEVIPRFTYNITWNRRNFETREIKIPEYETVTPSNQKPQPSWMENWNLQKYSLMQGNFFLERTSRDQMISTRYLSLRDIVNPNFTETEVIEQIDTLYFSKSEKQTMHNLVKILYAGKPSEEKEIVSNLFANEIDFAKVLRNTIFTIEILPLIHGIFLQEILTKIDERIIKSSLPKLSSPVLNMIQSSLSKNKWKMVRESPSLDEKHTDNLINIIETSIFQRFSRQIYYKEGSYLAYRIPNKTTDKSLIENHIGEDSKKFQFFSSKESISFFARTKTSILFITRDWIDILRFDIFIQKNEIENSCFYRLPPNLIIRISLSGNPKFVIGAGITKSKSSFEFSLIDGSY